MKIIRTTGCRGPSLAVLCLPLFITGGCTTLTEGECRNLDWQDLGYREGLRGEAVDNIDGYREDCSKYGIAADMPAYERGRGVGLREYCRPANGFKMGSTGSRFRDVCPRDLAGQFVVAYEDGRQLNNFRRRVTELEIRLQDARTELAAAKEALAAKDSIRNNTTPEQRGEEAGANRLAANVDRLSGAIRRLEDELYTAQVYLQRYREQVQYKY